MNSNETQQALLGGVSDKESQSDFAPLQSAASLWGTLTSTPARLVAVLGAALFVIGATPLMLVASPPLQDLPNHLASATVILHPTQYPEYVFNGFTKTNTALFAWLVALGPVVGLQLAGKLFTLLTVGAMSWAIPAFVHAFGGRRRAIVSTFFAWPMVHNWFVAMGMLDFALGVALSLVLLTLMKAQLDSFERQEGTSRSTVVRGAAMGLLAVGLWFTHVFPLLIVGLLLVVEVVRSLTTHERKLTSWLPVAIPLVPGGVLAALALATHITEPRGAMTAYTGALRHPSSWELFYNLWAEWMWTFTKLSMGSLVACIGLVIAVAFFAKNRPTFFSWPALGILAVAYALMPSELANWYSVNSRFIPFIWLGLLLRVPESLPVRMSALLGAAAATYCVGNCVDYVRLDREATELTRAMDKVPVGAKLLPLVFRSKRTSENTQSLLHVWGYYVAERQTSAPLLFAHSRSFPVMYKAPPSLQLHQKSLESFSRNMGTPDTLCSELASIGIRAHDCTDLWQQRWREFFSDVTPAFTHVVTFDAPGELPALPSQYHRVYSDGRVSLYARDESPALATHTTP